MDNDRERAAETIRDAREFAALILIEADRGTTRELTEIRGRLEAEIQVLGVAPAVLTAN